MAFTGSDSRPQGQDAVVFQQNDALPRRLQGEGAMGLFQGGGRLGNRGKMLQFFHFFTSLPMSVRSAGASAAPGPTGS